MKKMKITFGDYYNDGHGKYETLIMLCSHSIEELFAAEKESDKKTGLTFETNSPGIKVVNEYEDSYIPDYVRAMMIEAGMDLTICDLFSGERYDLADMEEGIEDFAELFMRYLKLSIPDLQWQWLKDPTPHAIFNCRAYGMFE